jgi:UDP-N-acetyl-D-mannosaminuronic acid dehydrogenase
MKDNANENLNVAIVGMGYVGMTLATVVCQKGFKVFGIDKSPKVIKYANEKKEAVFFEDGVDQQIKEEIGKTLFISDRLESDVYYSVFIITVGTPLVEGTNDPNFDYIISAIKEIESSYDGSQLIILRSTVSVGVTRSIVIPYLAKMARIDENQVKVAFCPERTAEGRAMIELQELPQIIGSNNISAQEGAERFFRALTPYVIRVESLEAAELVKLLNNTYRDISFSIGNVFNEIAQSLGLNGIELINACNQGYKRSDIAAPGLVGGPCLSKDTYLLAKTLDDGAGKSFIINSRKYNNNLTKRITDWVFKNYNTENDIIGLSGLAFKGQPVTSDLRDSPSLQIYNYLIKKGYRVKVHDFIVKEELLNEEGISSDSIENDITVLADSCNCLLLLNNHPSYKKIDFNQILVEKREDSFLIVDIWNNLKVKLLNNQKNRVRTLGNLFK